MKSLIFIYMFIFIVQARFAQAPDIIWQKSFGGSDYDQPAKIITAPDSSFLLFGDTRSVDFDIENNHGSRDIWLLNIDVSGNLLWENTYGGSSIDYGRSLTIGNDNQVLMTGYTNSIDGDVSEFYGIYDYWTVASDLLGTIVWGKNFGGSEYDGSRGISELLDGYLIIGDSKSSDGDVLGLHGITNSDFWVIKISNEGDLIWQKCYGSNNTEQPNSIVKTLENEYIIAGTTLGEGGDVTGNHGSTDIWVIKIDSVGNLIWQKCYGGSDVDGISKILNTPDGGFILSGETYSNNGDVSGFHGGINDGWIIKIDSIGNIEWQKCYGGSGSDEIYSIILLDDGNFLFGGRSTSADGDLTENKDGNDCWLVKINPEGDIIWQKSFGGYDEDVIYDIVEAENGDIIFLAESLSSDGDLTLNMGNWDFWVVRLGYCTTKYFEDTDGDGYGDISSDTLSCELPTVMF
ncbi:MAG: hypothetical protein IPI65_20580 [Bacteroidetes bacterium]|nr:hypothetical protein [Bacteroidota bacterium]